MKQILENLSDALTDYTVGTMIAIALTAVARRNARHRRRLSIES